ELMRKDTDEQTYDVIIDLNLDHPGGRDGARDEVEALIKETTAGDPAQGINQAVSQRSQQYLFARLSKESIEALVRQDN
ncbi:MAG: hypothetical protein ACK549_07590, partial [Cyanobacteriota bacterium]